MVKKCGLLKIIHDHFKKSGKQENPALKEYIHSFESAVEINKDLQPLLEKNQVCCTILVLSSE